MICQTACLLFPAGRLRFLESPSRRPLIILYPALLIFPIFLLS
ncbi:hypothetical protein CLOM621_06276 [Clostridium sp. M62/1]|nr:hypothetical protein CLOM621_06276 [Clostridium sp. M62/1]